MKLNSTLLTNKFLHYHRFFRCSCSTFQEKCRIQYNEYALFMTHTIAVHSHSTTAPNYNNHFNDFCFLFSKFFAFTALAFWMLSLCHVNKFFINKNCRKSFFLLESFGIVLLAVHVLIYRSDNHYKIHEASLAEEQ